MLRRTGLLLVLLIAGCDDRGPATVGGTVTFDGGKLKAGVVGFHPETVGATPVYGPISGESTYTLTSDEVPNLPAGSYIVTIVGREPVIPRPGAPGAQGKQLTPDKYAGRDTSPLRAIIRPGANTVDFNVTTD